jgi:hypothetical protein
LFTPFGLCFRDTLTDVLSGLLAKAIAYTFSADFGCLVSKVRMQKLGFEIE